MIRQAWFKLYFRPQSYHVMYFSLIKQQLHLKQRVIQILVSMEECAKKQESTRISIAFVLTLGSKEGFVTVSNGIGSNMRGVNK